MSNKRIDIGNFRDDPEKLYTLCIQLSAIFDTTSWDEESELYLQFRMLINSLWSSLPPIVTIDFRDPDTIGLSD